MKFTTDLELLHNRLTSGYLDRPLREQADVLTDMLEKLLSQAESHAAQLRDCLPMCTDQHQRAEELCEWLGEAVSSLVAVSQAREENE